MAGLQYVLKRLALMVPTFILVMIIIFLLVRLLPGDPAIAIAGDKASDADLAAIREKLGLNDPLLVQFWLFFTNTLQGDLGRSIMMRTSVSSVILERLPTTGFLALFAVTLSLLIAGPLAFVAALNRGKWPDTVIRTVFQVGLSMPVLSAVMQQMVETLAAMKADTVQASGLMSFEEVRERVGLNAYYAASEGYKA